MKILSVSFYNLNSLKGEWTLQFDQPPLSEVGLFAITGPTGAGKSTILDAITAGLYGRVPRHGLNRPEEVMTRHTGSCGAEVTFLAGGKAYRATWGLRRAGNKPEGRLQQPLHQLAELPEETIFDLKNREVPEKIAQLTGLDFDRFLRSVMLSQGDFAAFLKAGENERGELLQKITGLEIYSEISTAAYERFQEEESALQELKNHLSGRSPLEASARQELLEQAEHFSAKINEHLAAMSQMDEQLRWLAELSQLSDELAENRSLLESIVQEQVLQQPAFKQLERHRQLQPFMESLGQLDILEENLTSGRENILSLQAGHEEALGQQEASQQLLAEAQQKHSEAEAALAEALPRIEKAKAVRQTLSTLQQQLDDSRKRYEQLLEKQAAQRDSLAAREKVLKERQQSLNQAQTYLAKNRADQQLPEQLPLLAKFFEDHSRLHQEHEKAQADQDANLLERQSLEKDLEVHNERLTSAYAQEKDLGVQLAEVSGASETQVDLEALQDRTTTLRLSIERFLQMAQRESARAAAESDLLNLAKKLSEVEQERQTVEEQLSQAREKLEDLSRLIEQARRLESYESERKLLKKGQPCPLCGSTEHPFSEHHQLSLLKDDDENRRQEARDAVKQLGARFAEIDRQWASLQTRLEERQKQREELGIVIQKDRRQSEQVLVDLGLSPASSLDDLEELLEEHLKAQSSRSAAQTSARHLQRQLAEIQATVRELEAERSRLQSQLDGSAIRLKEGTKGLSGRAEVLNKLVDQLQSSLKPFGEKPDFSNSETLLPALKERSERYLAFQKESQELTAAIETVSAEITFQGSSQQELGLEVGEARTTMETSEKRLETLRQELRKLLDDQSPEQFQEALNTALDQARKVATSAGERRATAEASLKAIENQLDQARKQATKQEKAVDQQRSRLLKALKKGGLDSIESLREVRLPAGEVSRLEAQQQSLKDRQSSVNALIANLESRVSKSRERALTGQSREILEATKEALQTEKGSLDSQLSELRFRLRQDDELREEHTHLAEQIRIQEKEYQRWGALSGLIGSKSGQVFSRYAQSLTLMRLIGFANEHLSRLNNRYRLRKVADEGESDGRTGKREVFLQIEIIDRYQADAVRSTNSLSGGESFLVSLALALGLSDLASRQHAIETLFIDEGFGTLDADTLDSALNTLENLQASGKTIGIISHVSALKERLGTRIQVQKGANGHSSLTLS